MDWQAGGSALCPLPLTWLGRLGEASFVGLTTIRWQAATLSRESKQYVFMEASRPRLDHGWVRVESLESFHWAPVPRRYLELCLDLGMNSTAQNLQAGFAGSPLMRLRAAS